MEHKLHNKNIEQNSLIGTIVNGDDFIFKQKPETAIKIVREINTSQLTYFKEYTTTTTKKS